VSVPSEPELPEACEEVVVSEPVDEANACSGRAIRNTVVKIKTAQANTRLATQYVFFILLIPYPAF
jgi:hypothetical protein